jgi:hypothetical protein
MQLMISKLGKSRDKAASENYFNKLAKTELVPQDTRFNVPLVNRPPTNIIDPQRQFELKKIQRANEFKINTSILEKQKEYSKNLASALKEFDQKNETNLHAVKEQLTTQDDKIRAKIEERRMNSMNKSISNSVSRNGGNNPSKSENRLNATSRNRGSIEPLKKVISIKLEEEFDDLQHGGLLSQLNDQPPSFRMKAK